DLDLRPVDAPGWDHRMFRLGGDLVIRLPSSAAYAPQVDKEQRWLPRLAANLPFAIPTPVASGRPALGYPWNWSVYRWIDGHVPRRPSAALVRALSAFLDALRRSPATDGPMPGEHNFHRGDGLIRYDEEVRRALLILEGRVRRDAVEKVWG